MPFLKSILPISFCFLIEIPDAVEVSVKSKSNILFLILDGMEKDVTPNFSKEL